ncbi:50S ribosome-binding GTPase [Candidatus Woesearchaeota archaeon]|nr:50S ribosome-binding GTPase [Candidatus Woesearchaeota archaeon]
MAQFWEHVNKVIEEADIIIEVLDARMIEETRHAEIEEKVRRSRKKILYVINKCDLVPKEKMEVAKRELVPSVFISSREHLGTTLLKKKILEMSRGEPVVVGILGYPNVGKSSLINALAGRRKAPTSAESGFTKGLLRVRVDKKIVLLDTPGVFPRNEKDLAKYGKIGAIDYSKIKNPEYVVLELLEEAKKKIQNYFEVYENDPEELLEKIAFKLNKLQKGGKPDTEATARFILKEWQIGKIQ